MTLATTPTSALTTTPRFDRIAADRWEHWEGPVTVWLTTLPFHYADFGIFPLEKARQAHARWLASLLARGLPLRVIRRLALDDPRLSRAALEAKANDYTQRRLRRSTTHEPNEQGAG
jgi:hypothetical protein